MVEPLVGGVTPQAFDYLLGEAAESVDLTITDRPQWCEPSQQRVVRISGIGVAKRATGLPPGEKWAYPSEPLLAGLAGHAIPVTFTGGIRGSESCFTIGTWAAVGEDPSVADNRLTVVKSLVAAPYRSIQLEEADFENEQATVGGIALGVPDPTPPDAVEGAAPWDRILRALSGSWCQARVIAEPIDTGELKRLRHKVLDELRSVMMAEQPFGATAAQLPPLSKHYGTVLEQLLTTLNEGLTAGAWRVGVYLRASSSEDFWRLAAAWRGTFTGEKSLLQPLRIAPRAEAAQLETCWGLPYSPPARGPGAWRHPFTAQTLLSTRQLAALIHLPRLEAPGFAVSLAPSFDSVAPPAPSGPSVRIGSVMHRDQPTSLDYRIALPALTRHVFICGVTGAGKTNSVFQLLDQIDAHGVPFLVLEPAKAEYRTLLTHPRIGPRLQVFTLGDETTSPLRLNPFAPLPGTPLSIHVDLLRALFTATWHLWEPLPQVLEKALYETYRDYGWDVSTGVNHRLEGAEPTADAYPTLADLSDKCESVVARLRYDPEAEARVRASLTSRLQSMRVGAKGRMLDTHATTDLSSLFEQPTVLELERMGDEGDRAFLMGLLLILLGEYRRANGYADTLRHMLVLEEAHRLLANSQHGGEDQGNPVQKAIEGFVNLLAEVRVYGEGVIIADQVPAKLAPEAVKNTNLKITHRLLADDDRKTVGGTMAMDEKEQTFLPTLRQGQAAVFSEGDDAPVLVKVPAVKDLSLTPTDDEIRTRAMATDTATCPFNCQATPEVCDLAAQLADSESVRRAAERMFTTCLAEPSAADAMWPRVMAAAAREANRPRIDWAAIERCLASRVANRWARAHAAHYGWSYADTAAFASSLRRLLASTVAETSGNQRKGGRLHAGDGSESFSDLVVRLHLRGPDPFPACSRICDNGLCLYRAPVAVHIERGAYPERWEVANAQPMPDRYGYMYDAALDAADHVVLTGRDAEALGADTEASRVALCFAQQMIAADPARGPDAIEFAVDEVLYAALAADMPEPAAD